VTFVTVADDPDDVPTDHTIKLYVCNTNSFDPNTQTCGGTLLASSSFVTSNPSATYFITIPTRDQNYNSYGFIVDQYGHAADPQGGLALITVDNAPPDVDTSTIDLNNSTTMVLSVPEGQTTGFTLSFQLTDNNSCVDSAGDPLELDSYELAVFRTTIGTSSCEASDTGDYDPNNCYVSALNPSIWNLSCTASTTTCGGPNDPSIQYDCTFPLWHVADPTDGVDGSDTVHWATDWSAAVRAIDNDGATSSYKISDDGVDVSSLMTYALDTDTIPYGQLEVGEFTPNLIATTSFRSTGNVGLNQLLSGNSMCENYSVSTPCDDNSATSTIRYDNQVYASSSVTFAVASSSGNFLPASSTPVEFALQIPKNISTTSSNTADTFWGIRVPGTITFSGSYRGQNFFEGVKSDPASW
jgi:hypothetical protein